MLTWTALVCTHNTSSRLQRLCVSQRTFCAEQFVRKWHLDYFFILTRTECLNIRQFEAHLLCSACFRAKLRLMLTCKWSTYWFSPSHLFFLLLCLLLLIPKFHLLSHTHYVTRLTSAAQSLLFGSSSFEPLFIYLFIIIVLSYTSGKWNFSSCLEQKHPDLRSPPPPTGGCGSGGRADCSLIV